MSLLTELRQKISSEYNIEELLTTTGLKSAMDEYVAILHYYDKHSIIEALLNSKYIVQGDYFFIIKVYSQHYFKIIDNDKTLLCDHIQRVFNNPAIHFEIRLIEIDYNEYISSKEWRLLKNRLLKERGFHCELCDSQRNLQIHHLTYERLGHEFDNDLMILCQECHQKSHNK